MFPFKVAVLSCFPISGIFFYNEKLYYWAKVYLSPKVVDDPIPESKLHDLGATTSTTQAQTRKQDETIDLTESLFTPLLSEEEELPLLEVGLTVILTPKGSRA